MSAANRAELEAFVAKLNAGDATFEEIRDFFSRHYAQ